MFFRFGLIYNLMRELLTIVIPCKNESTNLIQTIDSIGFDFKVIVADSSTDNTRELLKEKYPQVEIVDGGLPSVARNNGSRFVNTPYLLFLDADMDISKVDLELILLEMVGRDDYLLTCQITTKSHYKWIYKIFYPIQKLISHWTPFAVGGFMLFKTEEFRRLGGFNEEDKFAEDYHLSMKVSAKKFKVYPDKAYTSDRRFKNKSVWYMVKLMMRCWLNRNNDEFYKKDYDYWK